MERAIGEVFEFEGEDYVAVEKEGCDGCDFDNGECCDCEVIGECSFNHRKDGKNVIFIKIVD